MLTKFLNLKKENRNKFVVIIAILSALSTGFMTYLMFVGQYGWSFPALAQIFKNMLTCFFAFDGISMSDIMRYGEYARTGGHLPQLFTTKEAWVFITSLYAIAMFTAPFCTFTVLFDSFSFIFSGEFFKKKVKKDDIVVFGSKHINRFINELKNNQTIHIISKEPLDSKQKALFKKKDVIHHQVDILKLGHRIDKWLSITRLKNAQKVLLFEEDMINMQIYQFCSEHSIFDKSGLVSILYSNETMASMIRSVYDERVEQKKEAATIDLFRLEDLYAEKIDTEILHNKTLPYLADREGGLDEDIRVLIAGFGGIGRSSLNKMISQLVVSDKNTVTFDVVDKSVETKAQTFSSKLGYDYVNFTNSSISIPSTKADGQLIVNFHNIDVLNHKFTEFLCRQQPYDFVLVSLGSLDPTLKCIDRMNINSIRKMTKNNKESSIVVVINENYSVAEYFIESMRKQNIDIIETNNCFDFDILFNNDQLQQAMEFNNHYNQLSNIVYSIISSIDATGTAPSAPILYQDSENKAVILEEWSNLSFYKQQSSYASSCHNKTKEFIITNYFKDKVLERLQETLLYNKNVVDYDNGKFVFKPNLSIDSLVSWCNENEFINKLARIEHRRWCYYNALDGFVYISDEDNKDASNNKKKKKHSCMCNWDTLSSSGQRKTCIYDLIPEFMFVLSNNNLKNNE